MNSDHSVVRRAGSLRRGITRLVLSLVALAGPLLALPVAGQVVTTAPARPLRDSRPALVLSIMGDLVYMKTADEIRARLIQAEADDRPLVFIQTSLQRSRPDVVLELVRAVRASKVPVAVHVRPADDMTSMPGGPPSQIGTGPLVIGLAARWCIVAPNIEFIQEPGSSLFELAPDKTDWTAINAELEAETAIALRRRGISEDVAEPLARALLEPREPLRLTGDGSPATLRIVTGTAEADDAGSPKAAGSVMPITNKRQDGLLATTLDRPTAKLLGLVDAEATQVREWLPKVNLPPREPDRETITPDMVKLPYLARGKFRIVDREIEAATKLLDLPDPDKRSVSKDKYRQASRSATDMLTKADTALSATEQLLKDFPEVLRTPPPSQTDVAAKPSSYAAKWRSMIQSRRDKLAKLRAKAEEFAAQ